VSLPVASTGGPRVDLSGGAFSHFRNDFLVTKEFTDDVGQMYGSLLYGQEAPNYADGNNTWGMTVMAPFTGPDFANKPIQPVHNHSIDAIAPFLDVDFLADSQGDVIPDGSSWTNVDYPEFYRIEIHGTGAVASARYAARKRNIFTLTTDGVVDTAGDYRIDEDPIPFLMDSTGTNGEILDGRTNHISAIGTHGIRNFAYREEYDYRRFVSFNKVKTASPLAPIVGPLTDDGITIIDVVDGSFVTFDPTTTPALTGADVSQTAVDDSGNVWVADRSAGLFKITDPLGAASIKHFTDADGIPSVAANTRCYGVAIGNGTSVWAMFEDGLSETTDGGTSWTNFDTGSVPDFTFVGITDGKWDDVWFIRANRDAIDPNNEIGIAKRRLVGAGDSSLESEIVWWTKASGGTATGTSLRFNSVSPAAFNCSRRGGLWLKGDVSYLLNGNEGTVNASGDTFHVVFGTSTETKQDILGDTSIHRPANFLYDNYDAPYFVCSGSRNQFQGNNLRDGLHSVDLTSGTTGLGATNNWHYSPAAHGEVNSVYGIPYIPESDTRGIMHFQAGTQANQAESMTMLSHDVLNSMGDFTTNADPQPFPLVGGQQPLNLEDTPLEEVVWDKYNWDGGSWTKGFHFPAVDTAPGSGSAYPPTDGVRKNFHTEDYTFYGRSLIDATPVFLPGVGAATPPGPGFTGPISNATFCFSITPVDKDDFLDDGETFLPGVAQRQEDERILISIEDTIGGATAGRAFRVWWEDPTGLISVEQDGVFTTLAPTPADGFTYRVVVIVDGSGAVGAPGISVFVDGVIAGAPVPFGGGGTFDWSNPGGSLVAYVGSRVFPFWQLETPHPFYFFRGDMINIQYWNVPFAAADIAADFGASPGGIIPAYSLPPFALTTLLVGRHELIASLTGTETKTTHIASETFINGIDIAFAAGIGTDFQDTDYFTFGVMDGIWKDNAIEMTQQFSMYVKPVDLTFSDYDNGSAGTTIPGAPVVVTEQLTFRENSIGGVTQLWNSEMLRPGAIELVASGTDTGAVAHQGIVSGTSGNVTFSVLHGFMECSVGLTDSPASISGTDYRYTTSGTFTHALRFNDDGTVDAYANNIIDVTGGGGTAITTYVAGDEFEIIKTGATISYNKNSGLIFTSGVAAPASTLYPKITGNTAGGQTGPAFSRGIFDAEVTFTRPALFMDIGIPGSSSGKYDSNFLRVETDIPESVRVLIGGSPATVTVSDTYFEAMVTPGAGTVTINGEAGWLLFNVADIGAVVSGDVTVIFDRI
jgi:hypothetical protein